MRSRLSSVCYYANGRFPVADLTTDNYISTENILTNKKGITRSTGLPAVSQVQAYQKDDVLISNIRPYFRKIWFAYCDGGCSNDVLVLRAKDNCHPKFLYYLLCDNRFFDYATATSKGTKMPRGDKNAIMQYNIPDMPFDVQINIANILSTFDDKIELNNRINKNLEAQAQAIFKSWFVDFEPYRDGELVDSELGPIPKGWKVDSLDSVANFTNGLAMQKFRPMPGDLGLPVLKIKELRQGSIDETSELCSSVIDKDFIVKDGDVIFSWSGSLMVDIWCGGTCGLNQHLFKVTSSRYDKWFYYIWTCYHLEEFQAIAKDKATTMGHIKRSHLAKAKVLIPSDAEYHSLNSVISPLVNLIIKNRLQNQKLAALRDTLLPKLMSGEIRVPLEV